MIESPYKEEFNNMRVAVMLEEKPLSGEFFQIMLTQEQFKKFTDLMFSFWPKEILNGIEGARIPMEDEVTAKMENVVNWYEQKRIDECEGT